MSMTRSIRVGIIGGTGMTQLELFEKVSEEHVTTPYGSTSSALVCGRVHGVECCFINRHGDTHRTMPTNVNYRANLFALKQAGCDVVLATTACGSLQDELKPGEFVIVDQFIDRTTKREQTFYDGKPESLKGVAHIPMGDPFSKVLRDILKRSCETSEVKFHPAGTCITIEGPRFSTRAESNLFRSWGAHIINMTLVPEVVLANELGMPYASVAMVTDYDCWRDETVCVAAVMETMKANRANALKVLTNAVQLMTDDSVGEAIKQDVLEAERRASSAAM